MQSCISPVAGDYTLEPFYLTVAEAATHIGVCTKTIRNYIKSGYLKSHRRGPRTIVISIDDIDHLYRPNGSYDRRF